MAGAVGLLLTREALSQANRKPTTANSFDIERFIDDVKTARAEGQHGVEEVLRRTVSQPGAVLAALGLMLVLFVATGVGNGSTFRMVPMLFEPAKAGPVLGWTSAVAAYGGFVVPSVFGSRIEAGRPETALYGFAGYYVSCLAVNWWFYARRGAGARC